MLTLTNFIAGEDQAPANGAYIDVIEPATGAAFARVPESDPQDVDRAARAAADALPAWSGTSASERSRLLLRLAELIERDLPVLAQAESRNTGKPVNVARTVDIPRSAANLRFFATAILHTFNESHDFDGAGVPGGVPALNYTLRRPRGVAGCISPWNLPLYLFTWKIAPALACGCTVVAKPSEITPVTAWMLGTLSREAGLPAGVLNIVHGGARTGASIVEHPLTTTLTFTGSTRVGRWIGSRAGEMLKRVSLELGGKNPFIVFDDADLDTPESGALDTAVRAAFSNQGQICLCGSRLLVHERVYQKVLNGVVERARALRPDDPAQESTKFGALVSKAHLQKVASMVDEARAAGGRVMCGGAACAAEQLPERCRGGYFYPPTVIDGLESSCRIVREEVFGPVVTVQRFRDEAHAMELANDTPYGLAASVFTRDIARAHRFASGVRAGVVWINCWMVRDLRTPFGGMQDSGVGREGGTEALRFFTEAKNVCVRVS